MLRRELPMRIHCDACGAEIDDEIALCEELDAGEIVWFCDAKCRAEAALFEDEEEPAEPAAAPGA